jgi:hypothetical protein
LGEPADQTKQVSGGDDQRPSGQSSRCGQRVRPRHRHPLRQSGAGRAGAIRGWVRRRAWRRPIDSFAGDGRSGRAFEILLGGEDFDGDLAERYGYVNRAVPDTEFVGFVNAFAKRVSRFDLLALADIKRFVNAASLPAAAALTAEMDAFAEAIARPAAPSIIGQAFEDGFQQRSDVELNLGAYAGKVARKPRAATSG